MDTAAYSVDLQARSITALPGGDGAHRFLVGTAAANSSNNKLHLLEYREETRVVDCCAVWAHEAGEVAHLAAAPAQEGSVSNGALFSSVHPAPRGVGAGAKMACSVFKVDESSLGELNTAARVGIDMTAHHWSPRGAQLPSAAVTRTGVSIVNVVSTGATIVGEEAVTAKFDVTAALEKSAADGSAPAAAAYAGSGLIAANAFCWDPHHADVAFAGAADALCRIDARAREVSVLRRAAHAAGRVRGVAHNPNRIYLLSTVGDDGRLCLWDVRKTGGSSTGSGCVETACLEAHDHRGLSVAYNAHHDQLLLTGGADHTAKLWHLPELSAKATEGGKKDLGNAAPLTSAAPARTLAEYGESVCGVAWSAEGPWVHASVAHSGKVLVEEVPKELKMQILMAAE